MLWRCPMAHSPYDWLATYDWLAPGAAAGAWVSRSIRGASGMARMKGGELIAEYLIKNKIPYVFGICGHGNVGMLDALYQARGHIKLVSPRHEQVAAHMADAYFRLRHEPGATLTACCHGFC